MRYNIFSVLFPQPAFLLLQSGVSPLLAACTEGGEIKIVKLLIKSGADIDICDEVSLIIINIKLFTQQASLTLC